jgi:hypothetical protein
MTLTSIYCDWFTDSKLLVLFMERSVRPGCQRRRKRGGRNAKTNIRWKRSTVLLVRTYQRWRDICVNCSTHVSADIIVTPGGLHLRIFCMYWAMPIVSYLARSITPISLPKSPKLNAVESKTILQYL